MALPQNKLEDIIAKRRLAEAEGRGTDEGAIPPTAEPREETMRIRPSAVPLEDLPARAEPEPLKPSEESLSAPTVPQPKRRRWLSIVGTVLVAAGTLAVVLLGVYSDFVTLYQKSWAAGIGLTIAWVCLLIPIIFWLGLRIRAYYRQGINSRIRSQFDSIQDPQARARLKEELEQYLQRQVARGRIPAEHERECLRRLNEAHFWTAPQAIKAAFSTMDKAARDRVSEVAIATAISTAISQRGWIDILLVVGKGLYLVTEVADIYGARPGTIGSLRLFYRSLRNGLFSGMFQNLGDAGGSAMAQFLGGVPLLGRGFSMAAQGMVNGSIMLRLGYGCIQECRPLPESERQIRDSFVSLMSAVRIEVKNTVQRFVSQKPRSADTGAVDSAPGPSAETDSGFQPG